MAEIPRGRVAAARQYRRDAVRAAGAAWGPERTHVSGGGDLQQLSIIRPHIVGAPVHGHEPRLVSPSRQRG